MRVVHDTLQLTCWGGDNETAVPGVRGKNSENLKTGEGKTKGSTIESLQRWFSLVVQVPKRYLEGGTQVK